VPPFRDSGGVGTPRGLMFRNSEGVGAPSRAVMFHNSEGVGRYVPLRHAAVRCAVMSPKGLILKGRRYPDT
jgi:hypothetical protein